jgi:hypothetical protein
MRQTAVEMYITALKNYKKTGGSIDDAIVIAETLLLSSEEVQRREDFQAGGKAGFNAANGKDFQTFDDYIQSLKQPKKD